MSAYESSVEGLGPNDHAENLAQEASTLSIRGLTTKASGCLVQFMLRGDSSPSAVHEQPEGGTRTPASARPEVHARLDVASPTSGLSIPTQTRFGVENVLLLVSSN